jgi:hypothetical protein
VECRVVAEILATGELRTQMLHVAADYERMADLADKLPDEASKDPEVPALRYHVRCCEPEAKQTDD